MSGKLRCTKADNGNTSASYFSDSRKKAIKEHNKKMREDKDYKKIFDLMIIGGRYV